MSLILSARFAVIFALLISPSPGASVLTARNSNARTAANTAETGLTLANVAAGNFRKLGSFAVDGYVYAQPLIAEGVAIAGSPKTLLVVATMHNSVYAFDADRPGSAPVWSANFGATLTSYPDVSTGPLLYGHEVGCLSTPVIDAATNRLYVVCSGATPGWTLRALDLSTGAVLASVAIAGSYGGLTFDPTYELQREALTLANGRVYVGSSSYADLGPYHGWIFAYDAATLAQAAVWCASPNSYGGGIWSAAAGISVDSAGFLYASTGNGPYDGISAWGESILKFTPDLAIADWFTPANFATLTANDSDLSSAAVMLIPGSSYAVTGGKDYRVYSVDTANMGHLQGSGVSTQQLFYTNPAGAITDHSGIYGGLLMNGRAYFPNTGGKIYSFSFTGSTFNTTPVVSVASFEFPGAQLSGSSNGAANGIVWATTASTSAMFTPAAGTLRAFDPGTLAELWSSGGRPGDALGTLSKFAVPTVANGKVYVATQDGAIAVYGLIGSAAMRGQAAKRGMSR